MSDQGLSESADEQPQPPRGHVRIIYLGPVAPHWRVDSDFGDRNVDGLAKPAGVVATWVARLQHRRRATRQSSMHFRGERSAFNTELR